MQLAPRELATVLAALRFYQNAQRGMTVPTSIRAIAADAGSPLSEYDIDDLCEKLNARTGIEATTVSIVRDRVLRAAIGPKWREGMAPAVLEFWTNEIYNALAAAFHAE